MASKAGDPRNTYRYRQLRKQILQRDGYRCQIQGPRCTQTATTADAILEHALGGSHYDPNNLRAACLACNCGRSANITRQHHTSTW